MSEKNSKSGLFVAVALLVALIAAAAYFTKTKKAEEAAPAAQEQTQGENKPTAQDDTPPQPETPKNVVVETKKLDITPAAPAAADAEKTASPAAAPLTGDLAAMMGKRALGSDSAPIKVVEYSSLTCGHCGAFHHTDFPKIKAEYIDTGKVQFIFKEFPLNEPAVVASQLLRCMPEAQFYNFMALLFDQQDSWAYKADFKDILKQNAKLAGLSDQQADACVANDALKKAIVSDAQAATVKFKIQSTPTFIVNDGAKVIVGHQPVSFFEDTFNELLKGGPAAAAPAAAPAPEATPAPAAAPTAAAPAPEAAPATAPAAPTPATDAAPATK